jgi:hypothetical protein
MNETRQIQITLNPDGVAAPAQRVVIVASRVVSAALRAFAKEDSSFADLQSGFMGYRFDGIDWSEEERRTTFRNWVLAKGFQDLARGVRETLEEALFFLETLKIPSGPTTIEAIEATMADIRSRAAKLQFPQLMESVNDGLNDRLSFTEEFISLQKVRNCLEHRGGIVAARDIDANVGTLILSFPRIRLFYRRGEEEIEIAAGEPIDTHDVDDDGGVALYIQRITRVREYRLGEAVVIDEADFAEIAMACHTFAGEVAAKLPSLPTPGQDAKR